MQKKINVLTVISVIIMAALLFGCAAMQKPSESNMKDPVITLGHVEVPYYTGYYYFGNKVKPTKGKAGNYGAPMMLAFIYEINNPNAYPVMLDGFKFSINFDDFEVNTVSSPEAMWIPAGKTNELRVPAIFDTRQTLLTLLLPGAMKLKEKKVSPWAVLEKWWTGAPDFSFPVTATGGAAIFQAGGVTRVVPFEATFP
jgi:Late embryogenesis abundant protein